MRSLLDQIELALMIEHFPQAVSNLKKIRLEELKSPQDRMQYYFKRDDLYFN